MNSDDTWEIAGKRKPSHRGGYRGRGRTQNPLLVPYKNRREYRYPAPEQPKCTISSNAVYILCQKMWEDDDMEKFSRFLASIKLIRKSIMRVGTDEEPIFDTKILNELSSIKDNVFPDYLTTRQVLPTNSKVFEAGIWYYIFRAMLPRVPYRRSLESFDIMSKIFENLLETHITAEYDKFRKEAEVRFEKDIRSNHLKKNEHTTESYQLRVKSYLKSFPEYQAMKTKIKQTYHEKILASITNMESVVGNDAIWNLFSMSFDIECPENVEKCTDDLASLKNRFFKEEHKDFSLDTCDASTYYAWLKIYPRVCRLNAYISYSSNKDIMNRDFSFIKDMHKAILYNEYKPFKEMPSAYKAIGLVPIRTEGEIMSALNKLSESNFDTLKYTFNTYSNADIVRSLFTSCPSKLFVNVYMRLFKFLDIDDTLIQIYSDLLNVKKESEDGVEKMFSEATIAGLYVYGYIDSIDIIVKKFNKVSIPEVLMCIYGNKKIFTEDRWKEVSKELLYYATLYSTKISGKYKWNLMDIIDDISPKKKE